MLIATNIFFGTFNCIQEIQLEYYNLTGVNLGSYFESEGRSQCDDFSCVSLRTLASKNSNKPFDFIDSITLRFRYILGYARGCSSDECPFRNLFGCNVLGRYKDY